MTSDERTGSLADQAAAWIPPWARHTAEADPTEPVEPVEPHADAETGADPGQERPVEAPTAATGMSEAGAEVSEAGAESASGPAPASDARAHADELEEPATSNPAVPVGGVSDESTAEKEEAGRADAAAVPAAGPVGGSVATTGVTGRRDEKLALLDEAELHGALEAILLVVDEPASEQVLAQVLEQPADRVRAALEALAGEYTRTGRGFELRRAAGGWRLYTRPEYASYVERFVLDGQSVRLTQAALETVAVVAYKQPVTRSRISAIRGVNCDGVIRTLLSRGLVQECGIEPDSGAHLYQTTTLFLEKLGIDSVDELPPLAPFLPNDVEEIADASR